MNRKCFGVFIVMAVLATITNQAKAAIATVPVLLNTEISEVNNVSRSSYGAVEANYWMDQLGFTRDPAVIQDAMDRYYMFAPEGMPRRWGDGWLSKFVASLLAIRAWDIRDKLTEPQKSQLNEILTDAIREETFRLDMTCGIDPWNSCSEDFVSYLALLSRVKNLYPTVAEKAGIGYVSSLERKYLELTFSTDKGYYSLVREQTQDGMRVLMHNHGEQSAVYTGLLLIYLNHTLRAYSLANNPLPDYFCQDWLMANIRDMFGWLQSVSTSDGLSFLNSCLNAEGNLVSCSDMKVANAVPRVIPAGRLMVNLVTSGVFKTEEIFSLHEYHYRFFDTTYNGGNISNNGRRADYNLDNQEFEVLWESPCHLSSHHSLRQPRRHLRSVDK
ncbi:MAG: hypothetical protein N2Z68_01810 [Patescibacteria group bacterium]|nr:hypothetical protein [Patescibacteria group bacterium]